jgi:hypothetical protein
MFPEKPKPQPQPQPQPTQTLQPPQPSPQLQMTGKFHFELKSLFIIIILYIALSNQWTDSLMNKILPMTTNSSIILTICKSIAFAIILMVFFNLYYKNI